jgi:hypothetical protein
MKNIKKNQLFIVFLSTTSIFIWILVFWQFHRSVNNEQPALTQRFSDNSGKMVSNISKNYLDSLFSKKPYPPDPFQRISIKREVKDMMPKLSKKTTKRPNSEIRYVGFLSDENGFIALLEFADGETTISREGETHRQIYISDIRKESINIIEDGIRFTIPIKQLTGNQ